MVSMHGMYTWISPYNIAHRLSGGGGGGRGDWVMKLYACTLGLGHATWSSTMLVSQSRMASFRENAT